MSLIAFKSNQLHLIAMLPNLKGIYVGIFLAIWLIWSIWNLIQPNVGLNQLSALFIFLPFSALLLAYCLISEDKDDDDYGNGLMQSARQ